ncbi:MAG: acyl--CoA ligase [Hellea sp.]|nr:acyl--CoA ligase [Hellea sp.]
MKQADPIIDSLMSPGAPFEVARSGAFRVFKNAPQNIIQTLQRSRSFGDLDFIVAGNQRLTYAQFFDRADALAGHLINDCHIQPGQSVAICMQNSPEWMIGFVAIQLAGGVAVLVNSRGTGEVMKAAIDDADTVLVLADQKRANTLSGAGLGIPVILNTDYASDITAYKAPERTSEDIAAMMFTSGTTGRAKAAALSHRALVHGVMNTQMAMVAIFQKMAADYGIEIETLRQQMPQSCSLLAFPLFHTSGCSAVFLTSMSTGGKLVLMDRWDGSKALELIEKERVSTFGGVPAMYWDMFDSPDYDKRDLSSLKALSCGGQALPLNLQKEIKTRFPQGFIGAGYGMTEMSGAVSQANGAAFLANPEASGQILPMTDVKIVDEEGAELAQGEVGEIWTKGATMMSAYYGNPGETAKAFADGWYKTGDVGRVDENGYIYVVDRKTDMVISGGENIYCAEVEQALGKHPAVQAVTTFGVPDDRMGERLVAAYQIAGNSISRDDLLAFAKANLAAYKVPTDIMIMGRPFELNAMGKVQKQKVRAKYLKGNG